MINADMKSCKHYSSTKTKDKYGEYQYTYTHDRDIDIAIYIFSQANVTNPLYLDTTHIGLTTDKNIKIKDNIDNYEVLYTNPQGRLNQVLLKEVI